MELNDEKCTTFLMKGRKWLTEWNEFVNQECIRTLGEKENYKYMRIQEDPLKQVEIK